MPIHDVPTLLKGVTAVQYSAVSPKTSTGTHSVRHSSGLV